MLAAIEAGSVRRYIFFSTQFVFRRPGVAPRGEDDYAPAEPYGASKVECERLIRRTLDRDRYLILRPTYVWGPGLTRFRDGLLYRVAKGQMLIGSDPRIARYYGYVKTVAAQAAAFARLELGDVAERVFYLTDDAVPLRTFCAALSAALGRGGVVEVATPVIRALGWVGAALESLGLRAPINAMQARELTTSFPVPAGRTLELTGERTDLAAAAAETVAWARSDPAWLARVS
jgi:nucleoside-diphosphate-sugar epimerase